MLRFSAPYLLALLLLLPLTAAYRRRKRPDPALRVSGRVDNIPRSFWLRIRHLVPGLKYAAAFLMILALAGPQSGAREVTILTEGINLILAVDVSESMAALDFQKDRDVINRLEAVKGVVGRFIRDRAGDRIGLVVFGSEAYTQLPITRDYGAIIDVLNRIEIGSAGGQTAIGDAIGISLKRLADAPGKTKVIILLTDGRSNMGELTPEAAMEIAAQSGVKIYTVGVGGRGEAPFLVKHPLVGERIVYQRVDIDEDTLKEIAKRTGGAYFRAEDTESLEKIAETIDQLEKTKAEIKTYGEYHDLYPYLLLPAFLLICLWVAAVNTRYLRVP